MVGGQLFFRPSDLVTRLAVLYGPSRDPGGGNAELQPLLSMPRLSSVRLVFQDYSAKGLGVGSYLRPSAWMVIELKKRTSLKLQLKLGGYRPLEEDVDTEPLQDITNYLDPLTVVEKSVVESSREVVKHYRGVSASIPNILRENGWSNETSCRILELYSREVILGWMEEQRLEIFT